MARRPATNSTGEIEIIPAELTSEPPTGVLFDDVAESLHLRVSEKRKRPYKRHISKRPQLTQGLVSTTNIHVKFTLGSVDKPQNEDMTDADCDRINVVSWGQNTFIGSLRSNK